MTTRTTTTRFDDLDGEPAANTVVFALDRHLYEIDLSDDNATALRQALAPYVDAGTLIGRVRSRPGRDRIGESVAGVEITGRPVPERGRIQEAMVNTYH